MRKQRWATVVVALSALAIVAAACGGDDTGGGDNALKNLSGSIEIDGSSTVEPITSAIAEEFKNAGASGVNTTVGIKGTGGGFERFCNGETDIQDASRPIKDEEKAICTQKGIEFVELKVATDGLSVMVNPSSTFVDCLTLAELKKVWDATSKIKNWSEVRAGFPSKPLTLYGPDTDSGTFDYFTKEVNGEEGASRSDYTASADDNVLVQGVEGDHGALGYFGYAYYIQNKDKLRLLGVDGGSGCVTPSESTINDGTYKPLSRPLYIYVKKASVARAEIKAFVDFYLEKVDSILADVGYIPLHADDLQASVQAWAAYKA